VLPCVSVAVQVTVVVPIAKVDPESGEHEGVMLPSTASLAEAEKVTVLPAAESASRVMSPGVETDGLVVSWTVIWNWPVPVSPAAFVALHETTVVVPSGKTSPELWSHVTTAAGSLLVTVNVTTAPAADVASAVISDGTVTTGAPADTGAASTAAATSDASATSAYPAPRSPRSLRRTLGSQPPAKQVDNGDGAEQRETHDAEYGPHPERHRHDSRPSQSAQRHGGEAEGSTLMAGRVDAR